MIMVVYWYTLVSFNSFRDYFNTTIYLPDGTSKTEYVCDTLYECFFFTLDLGLRSGGGIGDAVLAPSFQAEQRTFFARLFFDLSFFAIVCVILLNGGT